MKNYWSADKIMLEVMMTRPGTGNAYTLKKLKYMDVYPQFYRKGPRCIMREGDTQGMQVEIPEACKAVNVIHSRVTLPSKILFDEMVRTMQPVTSEVYEKYMKFFYHVRLRQLKTWNKREIDLLKEKIDMHARQA